MNMRQLIYQKMPKIEIGGMEFGVGGVDQLTLARAAGAALAHTRANLPVNEHEIEIDTTQHIEKFMASLEDQEQAAGFARLFGLERCRTEWQFRTAMMAISYYSEFVAACSLVSSETYRPIDDYEQIGALRQLMAMENAFERIMEIREATKNAQAPSGSPEQSADGETSESDQKDS